ncbi:MAG: HEAT repeat domain-containing protein [Planctomycetota bacterium]
MDYDDLPEDHRALLDAYRLAAPDWSTRRDAALEDPALASFLVDNLAASMVQSFDSARLGGIETPDSPFNRAQKELVAIGDASTPLLIEMVAADDDILAHLGADTLVRIGESAISSTLTLLENERPVVRRRAAELLGAMPGPSAEEVTILAVLARVGAEDPDWLVRAQAARAIGARCAYLPRTGALLQALTRISGDRDSVVASEAARALGQVGELDGARVLVRLLEHALAEGEPRLYRAAQESLVEISGGQPESDPAGWREWIASQARPR